MIIDNKVIAHLQEKGLINDFLLTQDIETMLNKPRFLDEPPKPIKLYSVKNQEVHGIAEEFNLLFTQYYPAGDVEDCGNIVIGEITRQVDYEVYIVLKILVMLGMSKDEQRAIACRDMFMSIVKFNGSYLTKGDMFINYLIPTGEYYHDTLCSAIIDSVFTPAEATQFKIAQIMIDKPDAKKFAAEVVEHYGADISFLEDFYVKAKADGVKVRGQTHERVALQYIYDKGVK